MTIVNQKIDNEVCSNTGLRGISVEEKAKEPVNKKFMERVDFVVSQHRSGLITHQEAVDAIRNLCYCYDQEKE